jgi:predicted dehydrogenase
VRDNKVVLQTGTQQRSSQRFRMACELVRNGRIGKLKEVNVWLPAGVRGGPFKPSRCPRTSIGISGRARHRFHDYMPERCHTTFRNWYDYSGGTMTDWGAHHMDIGYWAVGLPAPTRRKQAARHPHPRRLHHLQRIRGEVHLSERRDLQRPHHRR